MKDSVCWRANTAATERAMRDNEVGAKLEQLGHNDVQVESHCLPHEHQCGGGHEHD